MSRFLFLIGIKHKIILALWFKKLKIILENYINLSIYNFLL